MAQLWRGFNDFFWSDHFWLPDNVTWKDLERTDNFFIPHVMDLWIILPIAVGLFLLRLAFERFIMTPIGRYHNISEKTPRKPSENAILEEAFKSKRKLLPHSSGLIELSKKTDMTPRQIERWWRQRRMVGKPSEMQRLGETGWRCFFYTSSFFGGLYVLWDKTWLWDTRYCWYGYPKQAVTDDVWWYYMLELGFYSSLIISLFIDNKRKDFVEMIVHHIVTILLISFSWTTNFVRVGTLVMVLHDAVDYWMEGAKIMKYCRYQRICDAMFVIFTLLWFITRICLFPLRILRTTLNEGHHILGWCRVYYFFNGLLLVLQLLHIIWFYMILRIAYYFVITGQVDKDSRSETEPSDTSDDDRKNDKICNGIIKGPHGDYASNNNSIIGKNSNNGKHAKNGKKHG